MVNNVNIKATITAEDKASATVSQFGNNVGKTNQKVVDSNNSTNLSFQRVLASTVTLGVASRSLIGVINDSVTAANREQAALTGLNSVSRAFKQDTNKATEAAKSLAEDGLITITDSALGLKNLLASGFSLDQATVLMKRFKDSAAFGRQSALSFGQAVTSATEGIKNGNSILVDNAGVTKNLSVILEEAGFSAQDLMRATQDATIRQALFNGILKETNPHLGDAERLTGLYAGKQAELSAQTTVLKARIGEALQPALVKLLETITPIVESFAKFATDHPQVVSAVLLISAALTGLLAVLGAVGLAISGLSPLARGAAVAVSGSISLIQATAGGLASFISSPAMIAPWGVLAAAGVGAFLAIKNAADEARRAVNAAADAAETANLAEAQAIKTIQSQINAGKISKETGAKLMGEIQHRASGGPVSANNPYIVGEQGPEMFIPKQSGTIVPNNKVGGSVTINISPNIGIYAGSAGERRKLAMQILEDLRDVANQQNTGLSTLLGATNPIGV